MNATLMVSFWRQRLTSPARLVVLAAVLVLPLLLVAAMKGAGLAILGDSFGLVMVFAVGMIGQDVSTGVLQLVLARPVRRWEYVLSRWLAASVAAAAAGLLQVLLAWAVMSLRGWAPEPDDALWFALGRLIEVFGMVAVMTLLSSLIGGFGDLVLYLMLTIGAAVTSMAGQALGWNAAAWIGRELSDFLTPRIEVVQLVTGAPSWYVIASYLSTVSLCLLLAVVSVNRKELSYASG